MENLPHKNGLSILHNLILQSMRSNIIALDHVTFPIVDNGTTHTKMAKFLTNVLGAEIDENAPWVHVFTGTNQFHLLPHQKYNGVVPGAIGITVQNLDGMLQRLRMKDIECTVECTDTSSVASTDDEDSSSEEEQLSKHSRISIVGPHGNLFQLYQCDVVDPLCQSLLSGISYVEHFVPMGSFDGIVRFYAKYFNVTGQVKQVWNSKACIIPCGDGQSLVFRETCDKLVHKLPCESVFGGHHICLYVREFKSTFEKCHDGKLLADNANYPEHCFSWRKAQYSNQFRIMNIVDPISNAIIATLEHEVRSVQHHKNNSVR